MLSPIEPIKSQHHLRLLARESHEILLTLSAHGDSAAYADGYVFEATSYQTRGGSAVRLQKNGAGVTSELAWESNKLNCEHGGYVILDGHIYMSQGVGWNCLDLKSGEERWFGRGPGKGSVIYAD